MTDQYVKGVTTLFNEYFAFSEVRIFVVIALNSLYDFFDMGFNLFCPVTFPFQG